MPCFIVMVSVCAMFQGDDGCMRHVLCFIVIVAVCAMFHSDGGCMCHVS